MIQLFEENDMDEVKHFNNIFKQLDSNRKIENFA